MMRTIALASHLALASAMAFEPAVSCTDADKSVWTSKGQAGFDTDMNTCGKQCLGQAACAKACITKREGYSDTCSGCFGDLVGCTAKNCWSKCIGGETPACKTCVETSCDAAFTTCSGFTPPKSSISGFAYGEPYAYSPNGCTGSKDPTAAVCYQGSASIFGIKETVKVKLLSFASGKGTMDLTASGVESISCPGKAFTKSGQSIKVDILDCTRGLIIVEDAKYCSDQDSIDITVKDTKVPIPISATLSKISC